MSELSIKVNIGGRVYPLTVKSEEEENVRKAAKLINDNIKKLEENYAVKDKQDLLAMSALEFASKMIERSIGTMEDENTFRKIAEMDHRLAEYLDKA